MGMVWVFQSDLYLRPGWYSLCCTEPGGATLDSSVERFGQRRPKDKCSCRLCQILTFPWCDCNACKVVHNYEATWWGQGPGTDLSCEAGSFIPLVRVQGEGSVPDICSSERLLGRALSVFQDPRWWWGCPGYFNIVVSPWPRLLRDLTLWLLHDITRIFLWEDRSKY